MNISDWTELPQALLNAVLERLVKASDYLRFSVVCKSWHWVAKHNQRRGANKMSICHQPPMLLICTGKNGIWRLYDVMENKMFKSQLHLSNRRFCGSAKGWLIAIDQRRIVSLINPFSRLKATPRKPNSIIHLPPLLATPNRDDDLRFWVGQCNYFVSKATISADPILYPNDCIVLVIYEDQGQLAFIRLNKDTTWTYVDQSRDSIEEVVPVQDRVYAIDYASKLLSFDTTATDQSNSHVKVVAEYGKKPCQLKTYLVDTTDQKEWLMVQRFFYTSNGDDRQTTKFRVFKLDYDKGKWIEKNTLDDVAIFLGDNSSISVLASNFVGCEQNCIYFTHDYEHMKLDVGPYGPHDLGVYNVTSGRFSKLYTNIDVRAMVKKSRRPPIWIEPNIQL